MAKAYRFPVRLLGPNGEIKTESWLILADNQMQARGVVELRWEAIKKEDIYTKIGIQLGAVTQENV